MPYTSVVSTTSLVVVVKFSSSEQPNVNLHMNNQKLFCSTLNLCDYPVSNAIYFSLNTFVSVSVQVKVSYNHIQGYKYL